MPMLDRDGVAIYYEVHGSGPAVLLSHGFTLTCRMWDPQIDALSKDHQVILWDMRGHGQSDSPEDQDLYTEELTVADMAAILRHLGVERAVVGGLSLGGYISLAFPMHHPGMTRAIMAFDTGPGFKNPEALRAWNERAERRARDLETQGADALGSPEGEERDQAEARKSVHRSYEGLARASRGMLAKKHSQVIESLPDIRVPTLVMAGDGDERYLRATDYMTAKIPGARKVILEGAGHVANAQVPEAFNAAVLEFLRDLP